MRYVAILCVSIDVCMHASGVCMYACMPDFIHACRYSLCMYLYICTIMLHVCICMLRYACMHD